MRSAELLLQKGPFLSVDSKRQSAITPAKAGLLLPSKRGQSELMRHFRLVFASFSFCLLVIGASLRAANPVEYRGFTIDTSRLRNDPNLESVIAAIERQIDIVWSVNLPPEFITFFQRVRFDLVPRGTFRAATPGLYSARTKSVQIVSGINRIGHLPVLLHELLHAYHDQCIPGGFSNGEIDRLYGVAEAHKLFDLHSHMMSNDKEYFACAGTTFLFGVTAQEPFKRERLQSQQPDAYGFLSKLFGPTTGAFQGSLKG